jgi:hypothetical protein
MPCAPIRSAMGEQPCAVTGDRTPSLPGLCAPVRTPRVIRGKPGRKARPGRTGPPGTAGAGPPGGRCRGPRAEDALRARGRGTDTPPTGAEGEDEDEDEDEDEGEGGGTAPAGGRRVDTAPWAWMPGRGTGPALPTGSAGSLRCLRRPSRPGRPRSASGATRAPLIRTTRVRAFAACAPARRPAAVPPARPPHGVTAAAGPRPRLTLGVSRFPSRRPRGSGRERGRGR